VYDLDVHKRLQRASFDFTESFALEYEARHGGGAAQAEADPSTTTTDCVEQDQDGAATTEEATYDDDDGGAGDFDSSPPACANPTRPVVASVPTGRGKRKNTLNGIIASTLVSPPAPVAAQHRPPAAPKTTPMGALQPARRSVQRKEAAGTDVSHAKQADPRTGTPLDPDVSFEIEMVTGGTTVNAALSHRILWRDNAAYTDWWQELPGGIDVTGDEYTGQLVRVLQLEQAPKASSGDAPRGAVLYVVLGAHLVGGDQRLCHEPSGKPHQLDLAGCTFDDTPRDWLMDMDAAHKVYTDVILGGLWGSESSLKAARDAWAGGSFLPSLADSMDVLRIAGATIQALETSPEARQALIELALFIGGPTEQQRMLIRGHSESVRRYFANGGLLYDCLTCLMALEPKHVKEMATEAAKFKALHPAAVLFDGARATGKL
jgi:hypothetical protein